MRSRTASLSAFSLVEVTLALAVAGFALLAIFGLLPIGLDNNQSAIKQSTAANIATSIIADLNQTPTAAQTTNSSLTSKSPLYGITVTSTSSTIISSTIYLNQSGGPFPAPTSPSSTSLYKAVITLTQPGTARTATYGSVVISWPAQAAGNGLGSVSAFVALDRN